MWADCNPEFACDTPLETVAEKDSPVDLQRLAALFEAEGHFTIGMTPACKSRNRMALYPTTGFTNSDPVLMAEICSSLERSGVEFTVRTNAQSGAGRKKKFDLSIHGYNRVRNVVDLLLPYLKTKREQAKILIAFVNSRKNGGRKDEYTAYEWSLCKRIRVLNGRIPGKLALAKAEALLADPEVNRTPRTIRYLQSYVKMCEEIKQEILAAKQDGNPPILERWLRRK